MDQTIQQQPAVGMDDTQPCASMRNLLAAVRAVEDAQGKLDESMREFRLTVAANTHDEEALAAEKTRLRRNIEDARAGLRSALTAYEKALAAMHFDDDEQRRLNDELLAEVREMLAMWTPAGTKVVH